MDLRKEYRQIIWQDIWSGSPGSWLPKFPERPRGQGSPYVGWGCRGWTSFLTIFGQQPSRHSWLFLDTADHRFGGPKSVPKVIENDAWRGGQLKGNERQMIGKWRKMKGKWRKMKENERKCKENGRNESKWKEMIGNEREMKGNERTW